MPPSARAPLAFTFAAYVALVVWLPWPLGSNRPWWWAIAELWIFALGLAWAFAYARGRVRVTEAFEGARPVLIAALVWCACVWAQLVPLPIGLVEVLSPEAARLHADAAWPLPARWVPLTLDSHGTLHAALKTSAYVAFFALTLLLLDGERRIRIACQALVVTGFLQAMYGGLAALAGGAQAHGSFVNRNHFAGYLELCLAVGLGLLIGGLTGERSRTWRQRLRNVAEWLLGPKMRLRLMLAVMVIALVLSRSRMGNTAFFASLLAAGALALALSRHATRSTVVVIASLVVVDILIVGAYFGVEQVVERIEQTSIEREERDDVAGDMLPMWRAYPLLGAGLGSFHVVFPRYRGEGVGVLYTHAHNDYLQFAVEAGALGLALLGFVVVASLAAAVRAQHLRRNPLMRGLAFGAVMGIVALMIHSWVDFNLQIPANAITFMMVLALAWIARHHGRRWRRRVGVAASEDDGATEDDAPLRGP